MNNATRSKKVSKTTNKNKRGASKVKRSTKSGAKKSTGKKSK